MQQALTLALFEHESVSLKGIRSLLHLNPTPFTNESQVLVALPERLKSWTSLEASGIELQVVSTVLPKQQGHNVRRVEIFLQNDTNERLDSFDYEIMLPVSILKHCTRYLSEKASSDPRMRCFRFDQSNNGPIGPHSLGHLTSFDYCMTCTFEDHDDITAIEFEPLVIARLWVKGTEYAVTKTSRQLAEDREDA